MFVEGQDTGTLRPLAGESSRRGEPAAADPILVDRVFRELGIERHASREVAVRSLAACRIKRLLPGNTDRGWTLFELRELSPDYNGCLRLDLQCFSLLCYAYPDLQQDEEQDHWAGATRDNIQEVVLERSRR